MKRIPCIPVHRLALQICFLFRQIWCEPSDLSTFSVNILDLGPPKSPTEQAFTKMLGYSAFPHRFFPFPNTHKQQGLFELVTSFATKKYMYLSCALLLGLLLYHSQWSLQFFPPVHKLCSSLWGSSEHSEVHKALFCAQRIQSPLWLSSLKNLGIYHLFVVSGAHFSLAVELLSSRKKHSWISLCAANFLLLLWGPQMPVIRAYYFQVLKSLNQSLAWNWNPFFCFALSLLLSVFHIEKSWQLKSLWLSAWVSFCISFANCIFPRKSLFSKLALQVFLFLSLGFFLPQGSSMSFLSIAINWLFAGVGLLFLFFLGLFHWFTPGLPWCEQWTTSFFELLAKLSSLEGVPQWGTSKEWQFLGSLIALSLALAYLQQRRLRNEIYRS